ncbi:MAG: enoyl-CoA hydratase-related protein [Alphaproteobacteria bacterium]
MPTLVAIQGGVIGGAVDMISACDMRYATKDAFFCIQEINLAMTADVGTFPRLCHLFAARHGARARLYQAPASGRSLLALISSTPFTTIEPPC